jgi:DNA polymerase V
MVDCNSFYASCERVFRPDLKNVPIAVLSNNDGCVIARSAECVLLGLKMGMPTFKVQSFCRHHGIKMFSSNYALYADISTRVMETLEEIVPDIEVYSIDEAFLNITGLVNVSQKVDPFLESFGQQIKHDILQRVGMPVCVGIAPTKTLSKLANYAAKKYKHTKGVVDLSQRSRQRKLMAITPVGEIWGIGRNTRRHLNDLGIHSALELCDAPVKQLRNRYSVTLERTINELRGIPCLDFKTQAAAKKEIFCSRSFGRKVTRFDEMLVALSSHVERAGKKLRLEKRQTTAMSVYIATNRYSQGDKQYRKSSFTQLPHPTNDTSELNRTAASLLKCIWREGYAYQKVGVMLHGLVSANDIQYDLFNAQQTEKSQRLMRVMDSVNGRYQNALSYASSMQTASCSNWMMKQEHLSPAYTTRWTDLPKVS